MEVERWKFKNIDQFEYLAGAVVKKAYRYSDHVRNLNAKERAFSHYSGGVPCCAHCGITDLRVLQLHHTGGDGYGKAHREKHKGALSYTKLEKEGYPDGIISLCANCHIIAHL